ncbi:class I adenylate-forming enzyme family protein [Candidatus Poribacteria bacterium]
MSIAEAFRKTFRRFPKKMAIEFGGKKITFGELDAVTNRIANSLKDLGVEKGDRIAQYVPNGFQLIYTTVSSFKLGAIVVPMNVAFREREITYFLQDSGAKVIVTDTERLPVLETVLKDLPDLEHVVVTDLDSDDPGEYIPFSDLSDNDDDSELNVDIQDDDGAFIFYTSGTTGRSKGALLTQQSVTSNLGALREAWRWTEDDLFLLTLPMFHIHGLGVGLCGSLYNGCSTIIRSKFDAADVLNTIQEQKATLFMGVPTMYFRLLDVEDCEECDVSSMRLFVSGSAPLSKELFTKFHKTFGHRILERAGMSESMMNYSNPYDGERRPGTVGFPLPGVEARIVDENFNDVPVNAEGEIVLRGPNLLKEYWRNEEATQNSFVDGWFKTGDICKRDENGYICIVGRSKDIIISGGVNLYPREIEEVVESIPAVKEAAVVGVPDEEFGEAVKACIILEDRAELSAEEVIAYCRERLASFKKPKHVEFLDALPKNAMGKIVKDKLKTL